MKESQSLVRTLKQCLKAHGLTYRDIAQQLALSESSIKRTFAEETFSMRRLEQICGLLDMSIYDLAKLNRSAEDEVKNVLTHDQEQALAHDERLFIGFHLAINGWTLEEILEFYDWSESEAIGMLVRLDRLGLIELLPENRIKLSTSNVIHWRKNGPVRRRYEPQVRDEFLRASFAEKDAMMIFETVELSVASTTLISRKMEQLVREINELADLDSTLPISRKESWGMVLAMRPWVFSLAKKFQL
ncbi:helix-turn-helix domain-containing protein [Microbulbifer sp. 2201CG32-9]|uniref:helix-turn-helix domain-containing protein n=1 Tax=Microbulbifer sp. 2201CG32-9 TaxID=3232309 RepID=UPI00345B4E7D